MNDTEIYQVLTKMRESDDIEKRVVAEVLLELLKEKDYREERDRNIRE